MTVGDSYWKSSNIDTLLGLGGAIFSYGSLLGIDTTEAAAGFTYSGNIADTAGPLGLVVFGGNIMTLWATTPTAAERIWRTGRSNWAVPPLWAAAR